jgi:hypothetical protein
MEKDLPETIRRKASVSHGGDHAWRQADVEEAIRAAREAGLACLGGQVQFQLPDGTCEAYWVNYDPKERRVAESWQDYVARSADESLHAFHRVCRETDFRLLAREFDFLRTRMDRKGYEPVDDLWFVLYFVKESQVPEATPHEGRIGHQPEVSRGPASKMDRRLGKANYETLAAAVGRAIDDADPVGLLVMGCPEDEYSAEIGTIVPRVSKASSSGEVRRIIHEEFVRWFGEGTAGPEEAYNEPALRIWEAVTAFRRTG